MDSLPETTSHKTAVGGEVTGNSPVAEGRVAVLQIYKLLQLVRKGLRPQIEKLVSCGVPNLINLTEPAEGLSALHTATLTNNVEMVEYLLSLGANPNIQNKKGITPAMLAEERGYDQIVAILPKIHAEGAGETAEQEAADQAQADRTTAGPALGGKGRGNFPLPICTVPPELTPLRQDTGLPNFMIEYYQPYTDPKRFDKDRPPKHPIEDDSPWYICEPPKAFRNINHCVREGDFESLCLAFSQNVPVDVNDCFYKTPLMTACGIGSLQLAKFLINLGADVNACDQFKWTPLHHACHAGNVDIVHLLLQSGAQLEAVTLNKVTPLIRAIKSSSLSCVEYLLNAGANVQATNKHDQGLLDIAKVFGNEKILDLIKDKLEKQPGAKDNKKKKPTQQLSPTPVKAPDMIPPATLKEHIISITPLSTTVEAADEHSICFAPRTVWGSQIASSAQLIERMTVLKKAHLAATSHKGPPKTN